MTNRTIFQEIAENHGKDIEALVRKYKDSMPLEDIEEDLRYSFNVIVNNICSRIELERQREKDRIKEMKEAMKAIKKACEKFNNCTNCPFEKYCRADYRDKDFSIPESWEIKENEN